MNLFDLVHYIYLAGGTTTKSDFSRENATRIAEASSRGLITTETPLDGFGNVWRVSPDGLVALFMRVGETIEGEYIVREATAVN